MKDDNIEVEEQKKILKTIIDMISKQDSSIYYESTNGISRIVHDFIHSNKMNAHQKDKVNSLSIEDIQILLSYH